MADKIYPKGAEKMLESGINFATDTLEFALVSSAYTYSDSHEFVSSLSGILARVAVTGRTTTGGVFGCGNPKFAAVAPGSTAKGLVLYKKGVNDAASPVLFYFDQITGFPMATSGTDVEGIINAGAHKLFALATP
jgi:hypothetical protein